MICQRPLPEVPAHANSVDGGSAHQCDAISLGHGHGDTVNIIGLQLVGADVKMDQLPPEVQSLCNDPIPKAQPWRVALGVAALAAQVKGTTAESVHAVACNCYDSGIVIQILVTLLVVGLSTLALVKSRFLASVGSQRNDEELQKLRLQVSQLQEERSQYERDLRTITVELQRAQRLLEQQQQQRAAPSTDAQPSAQRAVRRRKHKIAQAPTTHTFVRGVANSRFEWLRHREDGAWSDGDVDD